MPLKIEFYYPNLEGKVYSPELYPCEMSTENMFETLQEPNPLDYAYETMKLLIMERYEDRPIEKASRLFARIDVFENEFYDFLVYVFNREHFKRDGSWENSKWHSIDEGFEYIKKESFLIVKRFIQIMRQ